MTVIAVKGRQMAGDKQGVFAGLRKTSTKIRRMPDGSLAGASGNSAMCRRLIQWLEDGADRDKYPDTTQDSTMLVLKPNGQILQYEGPLPINVEDGYCAIGAGQDFAAAAMHLGHTAQEGVELACALCAHCGGGIDVLEL